MSLSNVLLLHVSTAFLPRNDQELEQERQEEYYAILDLPKFAPSDEVRRAYRRASLKLQCDRMMMEWNGDSTEVLDEKERRLQKAYRVLGDRHLRQQYHLLQCQPSRSKVLEGPIAIYNRITQTRRWFPFLVLQSVIA